MTLTPLFAAIAPFILWPIEIFFPYPHIIEELTKALLIFLSLKSARSTWVYSTILIGFLFSLSENILYLFNGQPNALFLRFALTMPMHIITCLVILGSVLISKKLIFLGLAGAIIIHYLFNIFIASGFDLVKFTNLIAK